MPSHAAVVAHRNHAAQGLSAQQLPWMLGTVGNLRDVGRSQAVHVENQSRRQNILFHYMPKKRQNETWDDCGERAVRAVIKNKLVLTYRTIMPTVWGHRSSSTETKILF